MRKCWVCDGDMSLLRESVTGEAVEECPKHGSRLGQGMELQRINKKLLRRIRAARKKMKALEAAAQLNLKQCTAMSHLKLSCVMSKDYKRLVEALDEGYKVLGLSNGEMAQAYLCDSKYPARYILEVASMKAAIEASSAEMFIQILEHESEFEYIDPEPCCAPEG